MSDPIILPTNTPPADSLIEPSPDPTPEPSPEPAPDTRAPVSDYERRLREENAEYRKRWSPYEELFDGFEDDDRAAVEQLVRLAKSGDEEARTQVAQVFGLQLPPDETPEYMTPAQVQAMLDERDAESAQQSAIESVYQRAESFGYKRGSEEMVRFLWHVNQQDDVDYEAADAAIKGERQRYIDEYLKEKGAQAGGTITQPSTPASTPQTAPPAKTFAEAAKRAQDRLRASQA